MGYRDTGSAMSFIRADLFPEVEISGKIEIFGINDKDPVSVPTALVKMSSPKFGTHDTIDIEVGILEHMKWEILLGNEIFEGTDLTDVSCVEGPRSGNDRRTTSVDNVAAENSDTVPLSDMTADSDVTYGRDRQAGTTAADSGSELTCSLTGHYDDATEVHAVTEPCSDASSENNTINVHSMDSASGAAAATQQLTDRISDLAQARSPLTDNGNNSNVTRRVSSTETSAVDTLMHDTADETDTDIEFMRLAGINAQTRGDELEPQNQQRLKFRLAQETDTSLRHWFGLAKSGSQVYVIRDGLLWKRKPVTVDSDNEFLLCIPESYRNDILRMAHDSLHSGCHTSHKRTLSKIRQTFT